MNSSEMKISIVCNINAEFFDQEKEDFTTNVGPTFSEDEALIFFANLSSDKELYKRLLSIINKKVDCIKTNEYFDLIKNNLNEIISQVYTNVIVVSAYNKSIKNKKTTVKSVRKMLIDDLENICSMAESFCQSLCEKDDRKKNIAAIWFDTFGLIDPVYYRIKSCKINGEFALCDVYQFTTGRGFIDFQYADAIKQGSVVKQCENCGKFFIPQKRSDEIYCDNFFSNGKTCKQIGYEQKVKNDDILNAYRTIYKTQNARKQRNKNNIKDANIKFEKWRKYAKSQLELCQQGAITLEMMKQTINDSKWLFS